MFTYWNDKGRYQKQYEEMRQAGWEFSKNSKKITRRYYRYYNDGDIPFRYRGINMWTPSCYIEELLEDDADQMILREYKRFSKRVA